MCLLCDSLDHEFVLAVVGVNVVVVAVVALAVHDAVTYENVMLSMNTSL